MDLNAGVSRCWSPSHRQLVYVSLLLISCVCSVNLWGGIQCRACGDGWASLSCTAWPSMATKPHLAAGTLSRLRPTGGRQLSSLSTDLSAKVEGAQAGKDGGRERGKEAATEDEEGKQSEKEEEEGGRRSLLAVSPTMSILNASVVVSSKVVLIHAPEEPFTIAGSNSSANNSVGSFYASASDRDGCGAVIRNTVLDDRNGRGMCYFILEERCLDSRSPHNITYQRVSYRKADLLSVMNGLKPLADEVVISYWWDAADKGGVGYSSETGIVSQPGYPGDPTMAEVYGMDVARSGEYLVLSATAEGWRNSRITFLNTSGGDRFSIDVDAANLRSLALSPTEDRLYVADVPTTPHQAEGGLRRILSLGVAEPYSPSTPVTLDTLCDLENDTRSAMITGGISFGARSLDSEGGCLYFVDSDGGKIWSVSDRSGKIGGDDGTTATLVAGSPENDDDTLTAVMAAAFRDPRDVVVTPDGCNLFVSQMDGKLRWIKLASRCGLGWRVETIARSDRHGLWGLAYVDGGGANLSVFVGSDNGHLFELVIDKSALHDCSGGSGGQSSSFPPPASLPSFHAAAIAAVDDEKGNTGRFPHQTILIIVVAIGTLSGVVLALAGLFWILSRRRNGPQGRARILGHRHLSWTPSSSASSTSSSSESGRSGVFVRSSTLLSGSGMDRCTSLTSSTVLEFPLSALSDCTDRFGQSSRIGSGGAFGDVYRGNVAGMPVAMVVMKGDLSAMEKRRFRAEVYLLSKIHHSNLVELIGYCQEGDVSILVYPYFPGGSLHARLHHRPLPRAAAGALPPLPKRAPLTLQERMSIALQVAEGLRFLHHGMGKSVIHGSLKSSNVLLSDGFGMNLQAAVADFGLATIVEKIFDGQPLSAVSAEPSVKGTDGYLAPEFEQNGRVTQKTDVYAFGVVLFEMLTGRKVVVAAGAAERKGQSIVDWLQPYFRDMTVELPDAVLESRLRDEVAGSPPAKQMVTDVLWLARECTLEEAYLRPSMNAASERIGNILWEAKNRSGGQLMGGFIDD